MNLYQIKLILSFCLLLFFVSCSEDESLEEQSIINSENIEAFSRGEGGGPDGNRPQNSNEVARQDHTVVSEWIDLFFRTRSICRWDAT